MKCDNIRKIMLKDGYYKGTKGCSGRVIFLDVREFFVNDTTAFDKNDFKVIELSDGNIIKTLGMDIVHLIIFKLTESGNFVPFITDFKKSCEAFDVL